MLRGAVGISVGSNDCFATGSEEVSGAAECIRILDITRE